MNKISLSLLCYILILFAACASSRKTVQEQSVATHTEADSLTITHKHAENMVREALTLSEFTAVIDSPLIILDMCDSGTIRCALIGARRVTIGNSSLAHEAAAAVQTEADSVTHTRNVNEARHTAMKYRAARPSLKIWFAGAVAVILLITAVALYLRRKIRYSR